MTVVDCAGDGRSRGRAHGEQARELVRESLERWQGVSAPEGAPEAYARQFVTDTGVVTAAERLLPDLVEELRGIAEGAGVPESLVFAYNLMDEQWWYELGAPPAEPGCSVLGVHRTGRAPLLAQNMDLPAWMDGSQLVLRISGADAPDALILTSAGLIGLTGVNHAGVAVCVNTLLMLEHGVARVPVAFAVRGALTQPSRERAVAFLRDLPHASGQHYAVAGPDGITGLEASAAEVVVSDDGSGPLLTHTNHPLAATQVDRAALAILEARGRTADSRRRLEVLSSLAEGVAGVEDAEAALADRTAPLCVQATESSVMSTFAGVAFEATAPPRADFCLGHPGVAAWETVAW